MKQGKMPQGKPKPNTMKRQKGKTSPRTDGGGGAKNGHMGRTVGTGK